MGEADILVLDDDEDVRGVLADMLAEAGHTVVAAGDALTALDEAAAHRFDVALIDVHMPGVDGFQALQLLRSATPDTACVMMSGVRDPELEQTCLANGARAFLHKPLHFKHIIELVDRLATREAALFSWETSTGDEAQPASESAATVPQDNARTAPAPEEPAHDEVRLRDPCAYLQSPDSDEVLARFACTVFAAMGADSLAACDWRGVVHDYHALPSEDAPWGEGLSGILVLRDAASGPFAGPATLRGRAIVAEGPLQCRAATAAEALSVSLRQSAQDGSVTLVRVGGALARDNVRAFSDALRRATRLGRSRVVLHLNGVTAMDSAAMRACVRVAKGLRGRNGDLKIAGATGDIWRTLEALGAHHTISCHATEADAVRAFRH